MAKIDRALIIRRQGVELSKQYAADCAKSCEKHNLPYEFIDAVEFLECEKAFESVGAKTSPTYKNTMGNCCCHASHIKCWKRIVEIDKPCIILEHDAIVKGDVRNIEIPDMDKWLMMRRASKLPLYVCHPEQVVCWSRTSTSNFKEGEQGKDGKKSSVTNYKEAFSPSWRKGLTK